MKNLNEIIDRTIINAAIEIHTSDEEVTVPGFLGMYLKAILIKIYDAAPCDGAAEHLIETYTGYAKAEASKANCEATNEQQ